MTTSLIQFSRTATLRGATFVGGSSAQNSVVLAGLGERTVVMEDVTFMPGARRMHVGAGQLVIRRLNMIDAYDTGIVVAGPGSLAIEGGTISGGTVGIEAVANGQVQLTNLVVSGTSGRALELEQGVGFVRFSTITDAGESSTAAPCAVSCNPSVAVTSSIIWQQSCTGQRRDAAGNCTFQSSIVANRPAPGIINDDPEFVSPATGDYRLRSSSPAKDAAPQGPVTDFEGDPRPDGPGFDLGADELRSGL